MEDIFQNVSRKDISFDSNVEVQSLKDAVFKLTTRVYLLEDFISGNFGKVLGNSGYTTSKVPSVSASTEKKQCFQSKSKHEVWDDSARRKRQGGKSKSKLRKISKLTATKNVNTATCCDTDVGSEIMEAERISTSQNIVKNEVFVEGTRIPESMCEDSFTTPLEQVEEDGEDGDHGEYNGKNEFVNDEKDNDAHLAFILSERGTHFITTPTENSQKRFFTSKGTIESSRVNSNSVAEIERHGIEGELRFIKSSQGKDMLIDKNNYTYTLHRVTKVGTKCWRCIKYSALKCKGITYTFEGKQLPARSSGTGSSHNHIADVAEMKSRLLRLKLASAAQNTTLSNSKLIESVLEEETSVAVKSLLPKMESLKNHMRRIRRQNKYIDNKASLINYTDSSN